jgi:hypothetical protein
MTVRVVSDVSSGFLAGQACDLRREVHEDPQQQSARYLGELQPIGCEYVGPNEVKVSLQDKTGQIFSYSVETAMLVRMVNMSVALINSATAQVFRDLDVF